MSDDLVKRLSHAITTATNDDTTEVGTEKRNRHVDRINVMLDVRARIEAMTAALEKADALAEAVDHERNMVCQDFDMQQECADAVDSTLADYRAARDAVK